MHDHEHGFAVAGEQLVATVTQGDWGDSYPAMRLKPGESPLAREYEAYIDMLPYGRVEPETGKANALRIVACVNACAGMEDPAEEIDKLRAKEGSP